LLSGGEDRGWPAAATMTTQLTPPRRAGD